MDDRTFDSHVRALAGAANRRTVLGALAGLLIGGTATALDADAKKKRRKCLKDSPPGQCCKSDGSCTCRNGGTVCEENCCLLGERCEDGACVAEAGLECRALGSTCKAAGQSCCDGLVCGSGQGGQGDVACYTPAGAACGRTADCVYGSSCVDGTCVADRQPDPEPEAPCDGDCCSNADCDAGYVCGAEKICVCAGQCCGNADCATGQICNEAQTCVCAGACCGNVTCGAGQRCDGANGCITCSGTGFQCYWLGNSTGNWTWEGRPGLSFDACRRLDSCSGGGGASGGGCYAWMDTTLCGLSA